MAKNKYCDLPIPDIHEDWGKASEGGLPYLNSRVQDFIKAQLNSKVGVFYLDEDGTYYMFANEEDKNSYLEDRSKDNLVIGSFVIPSTFRMRVKADTATYYALTGSKNNKIIFGFKAEDNAGLATNEPVTIVYTFSNSGGTISTTREYDSNPGEDGYTNVEFLVDEFLSNGVNRIAMKITGRYNGNNGAISTVSLTYNIIDLKFSSDFVFSAPVASNNIVRVPYTLEGPGNKYITWYIDGIEQEQGQSKTAINETIFRGEKSFSGLTVGHHTVQARAYTDFNGTTYYSKTLYFDFVVCPPAGESWSTYNGYILLGLTLDEPVISTGTGNTRTVSVSQYQTLSYKVAIYHPVYDTLNLVITDNKNENIRRDAKRYQSDTENGILNLSYVPKSDGVNTLTIKAYYNGSEVAEESISVITEKESTDVTEVTESLLLKLTAKGRSNNEANPAEWSYNGITTSFGSLKFAGRSGWLEEKGKDGQTVSSLMIPANKSISINGFVPFNNATNILNNGLTFEIDFEATNITDETATIMKFGSGDNTVLSITGTTALLKPKGANANSINTKFKGGDRLHLAFTIAHTKGLMYIVNNGILERVGTYDNYADFTSADNIVIGSTGCDVKVYAIRVYGRGLDPDETFRNYAVDSDDFLAISDRNDIRDSYTGAISIDKVKGKIPVMIITGDISTIIGISSKEAKNTWNAEGVKIEFIDPDDPTRDFVIEDAPIRLQGTTSISYPRKNFRIYTVPKDSGRNPVLTVNGVVVDDGKYSFKKDAAPVTCWCLKADYAESSGSHNTGIARLWNDIMYKTSINGEYRLRTNAQKAALENNYEYDVRTTIDGFPIVLFNVHNDGTVECLGQYNFNNDKSTEDVFGFKDIPSFDNTHMQCFECTSNDNDIALFNFSTGSDVSDAAYFDAHWEDSFEARYPDKNKNVDALRTLACWIASCKDDLENTGNRKWKNEKASHFDLPKLAAYYIYLLRFGAVDQSVKNSMLTTEDGVHWYFINYDNDTILGIDNNSRQFPTWDYDFDTIVPGTENNEKPSYYYAGGGESVLWRCFEADPECMALATQIDDALYNAGLRYSEICKMFDDNQSAKWCERIYNENGRYKYIAPYLNNAGSANLHMLQGARTSHRHWWLEHRLEKYDNKFCTGTYIVRAIRMKASNAPKFAEGSQIKFKPAITSNFSYAIGGSEYGREECTPNGSFYTMPGLLSDLGTTEYLYIYNANNISELDLTEFSGGFTELNLSDAVDLSGSSYLKKLLLGSATSDENSGTTGLKTIAGLGTQINLEELNVRNFKELQLSNLYELYNLHKLDARDTNLTEFKPADGVTLTEVWLPSTITSIIMNSAYLNSGALHFTPNIANLKTLQLKNVNQEIVSMINTWSADLENAGQLSNPEINLSLTDIDWTMTVDEIVRLGKIMNNGNSNNVITGRITIESYFGQQEFEKIVAEFGTDVFVPTNSLVLNIRYGDGIIFGSRVLQKSDDTSKYTAIFFNTSAAITYELTDTEGNSIGELRTEGGRPFYWYQGIRLYRDEGYLDPSGLLNEINRVDVKVKAICGQKTPASCDVTVFKQVSAPSSVGITGDIIQCSTGKHSYSLAFSPADYSNVPIAEFTLTELDGTTPIPATIAKVEDVTENGCNINVVTLTRSFRKIKLNAKVTFHYGNYGERNATKIIALQELGAPVDMGLDTIKFINCNLGADSPLSAGTALSYANSSSYMEGVTRLPTAAEFALLANSSNYTITDEGDYLVCTCKFGEDTTGNFIILPKGNYIESDSIDSDNCKAAVVGTSINANSSLAKSVAANIRLVEEYTRPDKVVINGNSLLTAANPTGTAYSYSLGFVGDYNTPITNKQWNIVSDENNVIVQNSFTQSEDGNSVTLRIREVTSEFVKVVIKVVVTFAKGNPMEETLAIGVQYAGYYVDLGLPSGLLWRNANLGTNNPEGIGNHYAWGETTGYANGSLRGNGAGFIEDNYTLQITSNLTLEQDAARKATNSDFAKIPSSADFTELFDACNISKATVNGVDGWKLTRKSSIDDVTNTTNNSNFIFLPYSAEYIGTEKASADTHKVALFTRTYADSTSKAATITEDGNGDAVAAVSGVYPYYGLNIRPVKGGSVVTINAWTDNSHTTGATTVLKLTCADGTIETVRTIQGTATIKIAKGTTAIESSISVIDIASFSTNDSLIHIIVDNSNADFIDLGLPSGLLWAKGNLAKKVDENTNIPYYVIGAVGENGSYFAGGELTGYNRGESHTFDLANYSATQADGTILPDRTVFASGDSTYDAAAAHLDGGWRMPTQSELQELVRECSHTLVDPATTGYGVNVMRLTGPNGKTLDFPVNGWWDNANVITYGVVGSIRCTMIAKGINMNAAYSTFSEGGIGGKQRGISIRPVI